MYVCENICFCTCTRVSLHICYVWFCTDVCVYISAYVNTYVCFCTCTGVSLHICYMFDFVQMSASTRASTTHKVRPGMTAVIMYVTVKMPWKVHTDVMRGKIYLHSFLVDYWEVTVQILYELHNLYVVFILKELWRKINIVSLFR